MADVATVEPQYPRLRVVDPRILQPNPHNPRVSPVLAAQDEQLIASIKARGIIQPPVVAEKDGALVIRAGHRRSKAAITLSLPTILVLETEPGTIDLMDALAENLIRASMNPVDIWGAVENLEAQGWNQEAIASALALTVRTVRKLKLLAKIHPPMLDVIAKGNMPAEEQLRTIANARVEDQVQVWKALRPKKGHDVAWWEIARALSKPRIPFSAAQFDDQLAEEFGVVWEEDLFEQAGEENRYTTNAEGFFGAQQAWMSAHLPPNGTVLTLNESGTANLPKGAERVSGKPAKGDKIGYYVDPRSAEIRSITYRLPKPTKPAKAGNGGRPSDASEDSALIKTRPDVTQKGAAMIGDIRTEALHQALARTEIPNETLIGLLVLAFAATNVSVETGQPYGRDDRRATADRISEGGVLTADPVLLTAAARDMLKVVLSCRANMTDSGFSSRVAGENARRHHPPAHNGNRGLPVLPVAARPGTQRRRRGGEGRGPGKGHARRHGQALRRRNLAFPRRGFRRHPRGTGRTRCPVAVLGHGRRGRDRGNRGAVGSGLAWPRGRPRSRRRRAGRTRLPDRRRISCVKRPACPGRPGITVPSREDVP